MNNQTHHPLVSGDFWILKVCIMSVKVFVSGRKSKLPTGNVCWQYGYLTLYCAASGQGWQWNIHWLLLNIIKLYQLNYLSLYRGDQMDRVQLCANLSLRCDLLMREGITLPSLPATCLSILMRATFFFVFLPGPKRIFLPQEQLDVGALQKHEKVFSEQWPNSLVKVSERLIPSPFTHINLSS